MRRPTTALFLGTAMLAAVAAGGENGPAAVQSKEQIVQFLKGAFAYAHKAAQSLTAANQTELMKSPWGDGQMVVYARMNGVIPPASR